MYMLYHLDTLYFSIVLSSAAKIAKWGQSSSVQTLTSFRELPDNCALTARLLSECRRRGTVEGVA